MLNALPCAILQNVVSRLHTPREYLNVYMCCKKVQTFLENDCLDVCIKVGSSKEIVFFRKITSLRHIRIHRSYTMVLDMSVFKHHVHLRFIYVNNGYNVINLPKNVAYVTGNTRLKMYTKNKSHKSNDESDDESDEAPSLLSVKEYFISRYASKKNKHKLSSSL